MKIVSAKTGMRDYAESGAERNSAAGDSWCVKIELPNRSAHAHFLIFGRRNAVDDAWVSRMFSLASR